MAAKAANDNRLKLRSIFARKLMKDRFVPLPFTLWTFAHAVTAGLLLLLALGRSD
jgi:hypothetical protein